MDQKKKFVKSVFVLISIVLFGFSIQAQTGKKVSLIVHYSVDDEKDNLERFVRLDFLDGNLISRKNLFTIDVDIAGWKYWIYSDRYILTSNQTVYEWRPNDELTYDLKTEKFIDRKNVPIFDKAKISEPFISKSPDERKSVNFKHRGMLLNPLIINIQGQDDVIISESFSVTVASRSSVIPSLPFKWLDDETILTQKKNGSLVTVKLDGTISAFPEIPCNADDFPQFRTTKAGVLIYRCSGEEYKIDIKNKTFTKIKIDLDFDFSEEFLDQETIYYYFDKEIGRGGIDIKTIDGYLATTFGRTNKNGFYDSNDINTIKVWNRFTKLWQVFKFDGSDVEILGWYE